jgi:hypothetical protein
VNAYALRQPDYLARGIGDMHELLPIDWFHSVTAGPEVAGGGISYDL